jgi:hypothetical protein
MATLHGIIIDRRLEEEKVKDSIRVNLESPSNKIESNCPRCLKYSTERIEVDAGIHGDSFRSRSRATAVFLALLIQTRT